MQHPNAIEDRVVDVNAEARTDGMAADIIAQARTIAGALETVRKLGQISEQMIGRLMTEIVERGLIGDATTREDELRRIASVMDLVAVACDAVKSSLSASVRILRDATERLDGYERPMEPPPAPEVDSTIAA